MKKNSQEEKKKKGQKKEKKIKTCFQGISALQKEREKYSSELTKIMKTQSHLSTRNVNRRINCVKNKNIDLTKETEEKRLQIEEAKVLNEQIVKDFDKVLAEGVKYRKRHHILKENMTNLLTVKMTVSSQLSRT